MSDNKILITIELTPDDELVARNAVTGDVLAQGDANLDLRQLRAILVSDVVAEVRRELVALIVNQDDGASERYT